MNQQLNIHDVKKVTVSKVKNLITTKDLNNCKPFYTQSISFEDVKGNVFTLTGYSFEKNVLTIKAQ